MNPVFQDKKSLDNNKQREYLKQQQQLRSITKSSPALSADDMIENLLSKKEIFQKKKDNNCQQQKDSSSKMDPVWLNDGKEPLIYRKIWEQVCTPASLTDTPKLSCILLGSGLATDTLGYIWSLTNTTVSGALTKVELYRNLALVALAQKGYSFTNLLVLNQFQEAPIPRLDLRPSLPVPMLPAMSAAPQNCATGLQTISTQSNPSVQAVPTVTETLSLLDTLTEPSAAPTSSQKVSAPAPALSVLSATDLNRLSSVPTESPSSSSSPNGDEDEFDDFKSADFFSAESLTVLDVKEDNASNSIGTPSSEDSFKTNRPSFIFPPEKKTITDETANALPVLDEGKIQNLNPLCPEEVNSNKESNSLTMSSLQEALREDLTLSPITFPGLAPTVPSAPVESDRYNALRQLAASSDDNSIDSIKGDICDDFGDFITASQPSSLSSDVNAVTVVTGQSASLQLDLQEKCLDACVEVLKEANDLFNSINDSKVLNEITSDDRGRKYLEEIVEIERIGLRIVSSKTNSQITDSEPCQQLEMLCKSLEPFAKPLEYTHMEEENGAKCGLCSCTVGPAHVKYGFNQYHAPCANLFLHVTGQLLPLTPLTQN